MDLEKLRDKVKKDIRALLISAPLGVPAHIFAKDYRQMNGKEIPCRELGHRNLEEFVLSIPDVVRVGNGPTGMVTFYPIATKETQHIVNMIRKQKKPAIRKAVIPSAIMARKTPVKMSSFSRRGGPSSRFTPRGGMRGNRPQAKIHPHSYSLPGSYPPILPPRFQRAQHQYSATYHPPSYSYGPPSMTYAGPSHLPLAQPVSRGPPRPHPVSGGAASRPRLGSFPERLHPQYTLSGERGTLPPAKPKQPVSSPSPSFSSSSSSSAPAAAASGNSLSGLWKEEFRSVSHMSVEEMNTWARNAKRTPIYKPVCVEGVASRQREDMFQEKKVLKILLKTTSYRRGRLFDGPPEAVQLHFIAPYWNLATHRQPYDLPEGVKVRVYGKPFAAFIKAKEKFEPAMRVLYYERVEGSTGSGGSSHSSPRESRSTTPKMEVNSSVLEENIFKLLMKFEKGTYAKRLGKVYQLEYKMTPPDNLLEKARDFPFVKIDKINEGNEIMHLKEEFRRRRSLQKAPSSSSSSAAQPRITPPLPGTVTFPDSESDSDELYEVLVSVVNSPFSFYVQIRDEDRLLPQFTEMEKQMNKYLSKNPSKVLQVKENDLCASFWGDVENGQWCRALVISVQDSMVNVMFPDYGNQECVALGDLRTLPPQFYHLPFQAVHCCLHGVLREEKIMGQEVDDFFADLAADKICALHVVDCSGARASVEILDKELDDDETINSKLITKFHPIASLSPQLPSPGEPMVAIKLADVDEHGQLSIQVVGPALSKLEELANQIEEKYSTGGEETAEVVVGGVYCAEYRLDHSWYRVKVLKETSPQKVTVVYVDYGNEEEIDKSGLRPKLETGLFSLPPQAVMCVLDGIPRDLWSTDAMDYLAHFIEVNELNLEVVDYCVKVMGGSSLTLPVVKLHVKNSEQELVCINEEMLRDPSLFGASGGVALPSHQQMCVARGSMSVSSPERRSDRGGASQRSQSVSSVPLVLPQVNIANETEGDTVFVSRSLALEQKDLASSGSSSDHKSATDQIQSRNGLRSNDRSDPARMNGGQINTLQAKDDSCDSSSISSLNVSDNFESDDVEKESPHVKESEKAGEPVHSPKECIRDGVPYVATPQVGAGKSGHLAAPSSASSLSRTSHSNSPSPAPVVPPHPPVSPSATPMTPPMSPPPAGSTDSDSSEAERFGGVVASNEWAELPIGKAVEVEVTWSSSPTNFTLLVLSNKPEVDSMTRQLQMEVQSEPYPPREFLLPGYVCAARYSLDSLWYRAVVKKPFKSHSMQIEVEFLDYGGSEMLPLSAIKCLPESCRNLPFQAVKASLYGVSGSVPSSPEMVKRFEDIVLRKRLYALRKEEKDLKSSRASVLLVDTSGKQDVVINKEFTE